jgi:hypothetical protein
MSYLETRSALAAVPRASSRHSPHRLAVVVALELLCLLMELIEPAVVILLCTLEEPDAKAPQSVPIDAGWEPLKRCTLLDPDDPFFVVGFRQCVNQLDLELP